MKLTLTLPGHTLAAARQKARAASLSLSALTTRLVNRDTRSRAQKAKAGAQADGS
jgi:hypothetical protein